MLGNRESAMCIICNMGDDLNKVSKADEFLAAFSASSAAMKRAADALLEVSRIAPEAEDRKRYDALHKQMVKQTREWNRLEQKREHHG